MKQVVRLAVTERRLSEFFKLAGCVVYGPTWRDGSLATVREREEWLDEELGRGLSGGIILISVDLVSLDPDRKLLEARPVLRRKPIVQAVPIDIDFIESGELTEEDDDDDDDDEIPQLRRLTKEIIYDRDEKLKRYDVLPRAFASGRAQILDWAKGTIWLEGPDLVTESWRDAPLKDYVSGELKLFGYVKNTEAALQKFRSQAEAALSLKLPRASNYLWDTIVGAMWRHLAYHPELNGRGCNDALVSCAPEYLESRGVKEDGMPPISSLQEAAHQVLDQRHTGDDGLPVRPNFSRTKKT